MTNLPLVQRLTRHPLPYDADAAAMVAESFADVDPAALPLLTGTAGCSPFLSDLMQSDPAWLREAITQAPESVVAHELALLEDHNVDTLGAALRQAKARIGLIAALADLGGAWALEPVTQALTDLADRSVDLCLQRLVADEIRRGKLPGATPEDAKTAAGMVVLAMGKMGAGELNYSSDIDLICLFDESRYPGAEHEARTAFIRVTRKMCALLSDRTAGGYVFRTDLRLRPDASVTPVCLSMAAAESYYESVGRTWERAAYIKARACGGDIAAGQRFLQTLTPFVWRKHLDFAAIQDAHDMRLRIRDHRRLHGPVAVEGHNMKLGVGGIREIEFFTQTRQLIAGGRDPDLRDPTTLGGLTALASKGWIEPDMADELAGHYRAHREVEHRLQMVNDAQTQEMPTTRDGLARIAFFSGNSSVDGYRNALKIRLERVDYLTEGFFAPGEAADGPDLSESARAIVSGWKNYPALRSDRAVAIFKRLRPVILSRLTRATNPDEALTAFDGFLAGLPTGVQIFSLFEANTQLVDLIVDVVSTAPALALYLSRNAGVLDAVIGGDFFSPWPGTAPLSAQLAAQLSDVLDYEGKLDAARRWMKEWHFRIGVHHLRGLIDAFEAGKQYADLAEAVLAAIWPVVGAEFAAKHGVAPGRGAMVLAMGSLGAGRLNAGSDLDLIVIYDAAEAEASDGKRPLAPRPYFARLTQAFVTALTAPMAEGRLYEVDMRLRPSGRQGPVATSLQSFHDYQKNDAWTWEHLALTRARPLTGAPDLMAEVESLRGEILRLKSTGETVLADVADMRTRLQAAKPGQGDWDAKNGPGRLMDIELMAQTCALRAGDPARRTEAQLRAGVKSRDLSQTDQTLLLDAYRLGWRLQAAARLLTDRPIDMQTLGEGGRSFLLRETDKADQDALQLALASTTKAAQAVIDAFMGSADKDNHDINT